MSGILTGQGLEQIETSAQKKAREQREQKKDEQRIEKQIAITDTKVCAFLTQTVRATYILMHLLQWNHIHLATRS